MYRDDDDPLADEIRELWISEYRMHLTGPSRDYDPGATADGGRDRGGRRHQPVWPRVARLIREKDIDPVVYVRAQFVNFRPGKPPHANTLAGKVALGNYYKYVESLPCNYKNQLGVENEQFVQALFLARGLFCELQNAVRYVLSDLQIPLSPLFRYAVACREELSDMREHWLEPARNQYLYDRGRYDDAWGMYIPNDLRSDR